MAVVTVPANPALLSWARVQAGLTESEAARRLNVTPDRLAEWETARRQPTTNQLRNLSKLYGRTPAFFFRSDGRATDVVGGPPDFRSRLGTGLGPSLTREIRRARARRDVFLELHGGGANELPYVARDAFRPREVAESLRELTGALSPDQMGFANASDAFTHWMQMVEDLGVLVFHMSRVDPNECQGLSLYEDVFPIIILNGADSPEVRTFTLFHELAHLIMRSGGVCQVFQGEAVETVCNRFAGEFLLPRERISSLVDGRDAAELIPQLAATFRVSQSAVAVRLRAMQLISQAELDDLLDTARRIAQEARERARERPGGPPAYRVKLRNLGPAYVTAVLDALDRDSITAVDAAYFLESKLSTVELMQDDLLRRRRA